LRITAASFSTAGVVESDNADRGFAVHYVDLNGDGVPDDRDSDGNPDLYPIVVLRKISASSPLGLRDENDLDNDGRVDAESEPDTDYPYLVPADVSRGRAALIPCAVNAAAFAAQLADSTGKPDVTKTVYAKTLDLTVLPLAVDAGDPLNPRPLKDIPPGHYAIYAVTATGQTWRVPNELSPEAISTLATGAIGLADQGATFVVKR
jgi:hypothetical protein